MQLGIDFGTCNSSAALVLNGALRPIKEPLKQGFSFPSSVFVPEAGEILVGQAAEHSRQRNPQRYRREFKRDLGSQDPYTLGSDPVLPEELVVEVLRKLKLEAGKVAQNFRADSLTGAIVTIPATYQSYKRQLMEEATRRAGFEQITLLEEPIAAAIYYANREQVLPSDRILVYDLGGGTFDATLIQKHTAGYEILTMPKGLTHCGGTDFDRQIYQDLKTRCSTELRQQLDNKAGWLARATVSDLCRDLKHQLSEELESTIYIPLGLGSVESYTLNRPDFNRMIAPLIDETLECCEQLLRSSGSNWSQIQHVLLVGGSCRIPYINEALQQRLGRSPLLVDEPELAVCLGAALHSEELTPPSSVVSVAMPAIVPPEPPTPPPVPAPPVEDIQQQYQRGLKMVHDNDNEAAIACFNEIIQRQPNHAGAVLGLGLAQFRAGHFQAAIQSCTQVLQLLPDDSTAYLLRGYSAIGSQNNNSALQDFEQVLRLNSKQAGLYLGRAVIFSFNRQSQAALTCYRVLKQLTVSQDHQIYNSIMAKAAQGNRKGVIEDLQKVILNFVSNSRS